MQYILIVNRVGNGTGNLYFRPLCTWKYLTKVTTISPIFAKRLISHFVNFQCLLVTMLTLTKQYQQQTTL